MDYKLFAIINTAKKLGIDSECLAGLIDACTSLDDLGTQLESSEAEILELKIPHLKDGFTIILKERIEAIRHATNEIIFYLPSREFRFSTDPSSTRDQYELISSETLTKLVAVL